MANTQHNNENHKPHNKFWRMEHLFDLMKHLSSSFQLSVCVALTRGSMTAYRISTTRLAISTMMVMISVQLESRG